MSRLDEIKQICRSLAERGWAELFQRQGLDLLARDLESELNRVLKINRGQPGFSDFCLEARRGIEPGDPARSLLYHALASPDVHPAGADRKIGNGCYATIDELDAIENYIYSKKPFDSSKLSEQYVIGVFAYEYRPAASGAHGYHADLVFSRTGIARVGTREAAWHGPWRSFRPDPSRRSGISVCPARYAAFIGRPSTADDDPVRVIGRRDEQDDLSRTFYYPIHKLFSGTDCISGSRVELTFKEFHRNEKLRKLHVVGGLEAAQGLDVNEPPFVRHSLKGGDLVKLVTTGASVLVMPRPTPTLVRLAVQKNPFSGKVEPARFNVPPKGRSNRYSTSLQMPTNGDARPVPEYVNIRHRVRKHGRRYVIDDLKRLGSAFQKTIDKGGYEAAHFIDQTCDGCITVSVPGLSPVGETIPAYSLVTAPHFFPLMDQLQISNWVRRSLINYQEHFRQGSPWPLCEGRRAVNIELPRADYPGVNAFARDDQTITAVVSLQPRSRIVSAPDRSKKFASHLTDAASNEFEPGWDISLAGDAEGNYLAAYGLGSPFPEDAKLCAALNSFWPAAAPDASRTFAIQFAPTAMPLLDAELGYHPGHPLVKTRKVKQSRGWDGEQGPFLEKIKRSWFVNAADLDRSDYVSNALANAIDIRRTSGVTSEEMIRRMDALRRCIEVLPPSNDWVSHTGLWLVTAHAVGDWATHDLRGASSLSGRGYNYVFVDYDNVPKRTSDLSRLRFRVKKLYECQISNDVVVFRRDGGKWNTKTVAPFDARHDDTKLARRSPE